MRAQTCPCRVLLPYAKVFDYSRRPIRPPVNQASSSIQVRTCQNSAQISFESQYRPTHRLAHRHAHMPTHRHRPTCTYAYNTHMDSVTFFCNFHVQHTLTWGVRNNY